MFDDLAQRADLALRTSSARATATSVFELVSTAAGQPPSSNEALLDQLAQRRGWTREDDSRFVCAFGERSETVVIPMILDREALALTIARAEVDVFLGDSAPPLLREFHALAKRELNRLFTDAE